MIAHIVLFKPKPDVSSRQLQGLLTLLGRSAVEIPGISRASVGRAIDIDPGYSRSMGDLTYPFAAILEFEARDQLIAYLRHSLHGELGRLFWEVCESTVVTEVELRPFSDPDLAEFLVVRP